MEIALAYVCCPSDAGRTKVQKYCRKIYELGYVPICPQLGFSPFFRRRRCGGYAGIPEDVAYGTQKVPDGGSVWKRDDRDMNTEISIADRNHIICTTLDGLVRIKESECIYVY